MNKIFLISVFSILTLNVMAQEKIVQTAGRTQLGEFAPKFAELNDDVLFGEVWSRTDKLGLRDRSLVTITSLISQGITDNSLVFHLQSAKRTASPVRRFAEIITHIGFYAGWPKAWAAFNLAKGVWQRTLPVKMPKPHSSVNDFPHWGTEHCICTVLHRQQLSCSRFTRAGFHL